MALRGGERALGLRGVLAAPEGRAVLSGQAEDTFQTKVPGVRAVRMHGHSKSRGVDTRGSSLYRAGSSQGRA